MTLIWRAGQHKDPSLSGQSSWCNPLLNSLPIAPSMSIYCFGSRDRPTEIAYLMKDQTVHKGKSADWSRPISTILVNSSGHQIWETTSGDGTIPWLSQTHMCSGEEIFGVRGWRGNAHLNPGQIQVPCASFECFHVLTMPRRQKLWNSSPQPRMKSWDCLHRFTKNMCCLRIVISAT